LLLAASFNPRPPLLAGDAVAPYLHNHPQQRFNPRPPLLAGDATGIEIVHQRLGVSIRARHCWRAMRCVVRTGGIPGCFNPRPPLLAGDAVLQGNYVREAACFNPRPPLLAGDARAIFGNIHLAMVSIRARHCWRAMQDHAGLELRLHRFNPRPPLLAGDAPSSGQITPDCTVSIRARHCWRAMPPRPRNPWPPTKWFQSAPAIAGGRCAARGSQ